MVLCLTKRMTTEFMIYISVCKLFNIVAYQKQVSLFLVSDGRKNKNIYIFRGFYTISHTQFISLTAKNLQLPQRRYHHQSLYPLVKFFICFSLTSTLLIWNPNVMTTERTVFLFVYYFRLLVNSSEPFSHILLFCQSFNFVFYQ